MIVVTEAEVIARLPSLLDEAKAEPVVISDGNKELGAIMSMADYEFVRTAKVDRLMRAMDALGSSLREAAGEEGISLEELEKMFDRKNK